MTGHWVQAGHAHNRRSMSPLDWYRACSRQPTRNVSTVHTVAHPTKCCKNGDSGKFIPSAANLLKMKLWRK
jgi:hypothetical protein